MYLSLVLLLLPGILCSKGMVKRNLNYLVGWYCSLAFIRNENVLLKTTCFSIGFSNHLPLSLSVFKYLFLSLCSVCLNISNGDMDMMFHDLHVPDNKLSDSILCVHNDSNNVSKDCFINCTNMPNGTQMFGDKSDICLLVESKQNVPQFNITSREYMEIAVQALCFTSRLSLSLHHHVE